MKLFVTLFVAVSLTVPLPAFAQESQPVELDSGQGFVPVANERQNDFVPMSTSVAETPIADDISKKVFEDLRAVRKAERIARSTCYTFLADHPIGLRQAHKNLRFGAMVRLGNNLAAVISSNVLFAIGRSSMMPTETERTAHAIVQCNKLLDQSS